MRILPHNTLSFTSTPIYDVKLKKLQPNGGCGEIDAQFSKLEHDDEDDKAIVQNLYKDWYSTDFGFSICASFLRPNIIGGDADFYVIEGIDKNGQRKIYSASEVNQKEGEICFIQAEPANREERIKGSGEVMLWGIGKTMKSDGENCFSLLSTTEAEGFYRHSGLTYDEEASFPEDDCKVFCLKNKDKEEYLKRIEEKYNLDVQG